MIQGENSGPHQGTIFYKYVVNFVKAKKWLWEPLVHHIPHMNVLDLKVFPSMSRRNRHFIRSLRGMHV